MVRSRQATGAVNVERPIRISQIQRFRAGLTDELPLNAQTVKIRLDQPKVAPLFEMAAVHQRCRRRPADYEAVSRLFCEFIPSGFSAILSTFDDLARLLRTADKNDPADRAHKPFTVCQHNFVECRGVAAFGSFVDF